MRRGKRKRKMYEKIFKLSSHRWKRIGSTNVPCFYRGLFKNLIMEKILKLLVFILIIWAIFCSCSKTEIKTEGQCLIISLKYTTTKVFLKTDTLYNDYLTGHWFEVFVENKKKWDQDTGFRVCDRDLFERRIYVIK